MSITIGVKVQKEELVFKNQYTNTGAPGVANVSLQRIGALPALLAPTVNQAIVLPLEKNHFEIRSILSIAEIQYRGSPTRYVVPLQDGICVSHPEELLQGDGFTCCILDQKTVVTFDDRVGWAHHTPNCN